MYHLPIYGMLSSIDASVSNKEAQTCFINDLHKVLPHNSGRYSAGILLYNKGIIYIHRCT